MITLIATLMGIHSTPALAQAYPADGPFYSGNYATGQAQAHRTARGTQALKFVSYNVAMGENTDKVIEDLKNISAVKDADFIQVQEVVGIKGGGGNDLDKIARALKMNYVFAPATVLFDKDYGNGILSRWPIGQFHKFLLPLSDADNQRIAVGTVANINGKMIRVYSIHLTVKFKDSFGGEGSRAEQVNGALAPIEKLQSLPTYISGDFNNFNPMGWSKVKKLFDGYKYAQVPDNGWTFKTRKLTLDHAFERGFNGIKSGVAYEAVGSDHVPIWATLELP
ncbi:MAG: hypothetical protein JST80_11095 [Bdellovibrionales bacterium]|nr:hypothetical protein [Bdellovibrionales bacterium]